jgi:hypothetical protein
MGVNGAEPRWFAQQRLHKPNEKRVFHTIGKIASMVGVTVVHGR